MISEEGIRSYLAKLLDAGEAHVELDRAVGGLAPALRGIRVPGFPHSIWELLEHIRIAQGDLTDFCLDPRYTESLTWPEDYWPTTAGPASDAEWDQSIATYHADRARLKALALDPARDLTAKIPAGTGQTYLRTLMVAVDHAGYHVGQIVVVRHLLGAWPPD